MSIANVVEKLRKIRKIKYKNQLNQKTLELLDSGINETRMLAGLIGESSLFVFSEAVMISTDCSELCKKGKKQANNKKPLQISIWKKQWL